MKCTKKTSIIYVFLFTLTCTGIHAQTLFDIDEFHIPDGLNLSDTEYDRLVNTGTQLREKLVADLQAQGYDVISPRKTKIKLKRVGIDDIRVDYDTAANRVIFGKLVKTSDYVAVYAYLYDAQTAIRSFDDPTKEFSFTRKASQLNDLAEINSAVKEIIAGLSLDRSDELKKAEMERKEQEQKAEMEQQKQAEIERQAELDRQKQEEMNPKEPEPKPEKPKKEKTPKPSKPVTDKQCSKTPGAVLVVAGGLMGGTGFYLRSRAKKIYDEEYRPIVGFAGDKDKLEEARKPNRMAHIIGAGGILTAGVGAFLWAKCGKKQKKKKKNSVGIEHFQITPHVEYNTMTNTNNVTARISFNF